MYSNDEIEFIKDFIGKHDDAKVYLGVDSQRAKKKRVKFATAVVIHYHDENGIGKGAKVFSDIEYIDAKQVQDAKLSRPFNRMLREVQMVTELYNQLEDILIERDFEIHIDVNPDEAAGSNVAYGAAKGMIYGMVGVEPICKPYAFAASCAADKYSK